MILPLIFEKIVDFQVSIAANRVRVPPFFFNIQMQMGMEHSHANLQKKILENEFSPLFSPYYLCVCGYAHSFFAVDFKSDALYWYIIYRFSKL